MSVYIKGMEMPKNCLFCPMSHWNKLDQLTGCEIIPGKKHIPESDADFWEHDRPDWCPLVEVPPHGRLIDADAMKNKQQKDADLFKGSSVYGDKVRYDEAVNAVANIVNAPTIIPAEREEEQEE